MENMYLYNKIIKIWIIFSVGRAHSGFIAEFFHLESKTVFGGFFVVVGVCIVLFKPYQNMNS